MQPGLEEVGRDPGRASALCPEADPPTLGRSGMSKASRPSASERAPAGTQHRAMPSQDLTSLGSGAKLIPNDTQRGREGSAQLPRSEPPDQPHAIAWRLCLLGWNHSASNHRARFGPGMTTVDASQIPGGDPSGSDTFARYRYQAKLTLLHWLGTLTPDGPRSVYAEHHEDILLEYDDRLAFIQVKTRVPTAGHWTVDIICSEGGGIDSLCRAYAVAKDSRCSFHLHLEGSASPSSGTASFIRDCSSASDSIRAKIKALLEAALGHAVDGELDDFLGRLRVVPNQPAQADIDGRCIRLLGRLTPATSAGEVENLYHRLLQIVEEAQEASDAAFGPDATGVEFLAAHLAHLLATETDVPLAAAAKRLTRDRLSSLVPSDEPPPAALLLIERTLDDRPLTALEEKLIAAGAKDSVVQDARRLRSLAEPRRLELLAGPDAHALRVEDVSNRVLVHARAIAQLCKTEGHTADVLWARLVTDAGLADTDQGGLFNGDRQSLVGLLCCLSDECLFPWQVP